MRKIEINDEVLIDLYASGKSSIAIANQLGISKPTVLKKLKDNGIKIRSYGSFDEITKEVLIELYVNDRLSQKEIAEKFGCGKTLIYKRLKKYGIETRKEPMDFSPEERKVIYGRQKEQHGLWKGGVTPLRNLVRNRLAPISKERMKIDNFTCQSCGRPIGDMHVHHIRPFAEILDEIINENQHINIMNENERLQMVDICEKDERLTNINNLITYCKVCHENQHTENPVEVINYEILEEQWRNFVKENHMEMSIKEMCSELPTNNHKVIRYMKANNISFAYDNKKWLEKRLHSQSYYQIAKEFHSKLYPCSTKVIKKKATEFGLDHIINSKKDILENKLSKETLHELYINKNLTYKQISNMYDCQPDTVKVLAKKYNIQSKYIEVSREELEKLHYIQHKTLKEISQKLNCTPSTVKRKFKEYKLKVNKYFDDAIHNRLSRNELTNLYCEEEKSLKEIGSIFGVSDQSIRNLVKRYKITKKNTVTKV
jgi:DNA-binding CsgD family transcriptional regulator